MTLPVPIFCPSQSTCPIFRGGAGRPPPQLSGITNPPVLSAACALHTRQAHSTAYPPLSVSLYAAPCIPTASLPWPRPALHFPPDCGPAACSPGLRALLFFSGQMISTVAAGRPVHRGVPQPHLACCCCARCAALCSPSSPLTLTPCQSRPRTQAARSLNTPSKWLPAPNAARPPLFLSPAQRHPAAPPRPPDTLLWRSLCLARVALLPFLLLPYLKPLSLLLETQLMLHHSRVTSATDC